MTKYLFIIGGVISGVGKGVATASIGRILQEHGFNVTTIKIDPYINVDAGTLRPTEHGEVWVTKDGGEIDQDLGNYERFLDIPIPKKNNITTGQIYKSIIDKERRGEFLGKTVQFIPHVPNEVKKRIKEASEGKDIVLVEIGGVVGDFENSPFLFSARSMENELGKENVSYVLVTYLPIPSHIYEMKTKPSQTSIKLLRKEGIQPDFILCRGKEPLDEVRKKKIEQSSNVSSDSIISMPDVASKENTPTTLYSVPLALEKEKLGEKILKKLDLEKNKEPDWNLWNDKVEKIVNPEKEVNIALVGKYLDVGDFQLKDSYISVNEALKHAGAYNNVRVNIFWIDSKEIEKGNADLSKYFGLLVPGGFGTSGVEGKIKAIKYARENNIPFLGLCFGLQLAVVEFARNICELNAHTTEVNPETEHKVIDILPEQKDMDKKGGTMRLGSYEAILRENSRVGRIYNSEKTSERHRHRYEVNPDYHKILEEKGLIISGSSHDKRLAEFIEIPEHKFFVATQAHPEFNSSLLSPSPLFCEFIKKCEE